ncbi:MAG: hypothetical protein A2289_19675 [Deltaproteobacteria bacterium RIFOXYA12_FULL_58_15]|nr:MAG: hypothetical protein A2289_19675 [Deltaproteobacteria bacterium RIFOXYA12_FULL_58_15]OGR13166.1 MAG: hypothetical protein A2341_08705 [Deltaproteobacteria bacterium RIFOXYB12_FULL_58_9]
MNDEKLIEHLGNVISWANVIREELEPIMDAHGSKVHFRPAAKGFSMVGLLPDRPQRAKAGYTKADGLLANFDEEFRTHCIDVDATKPSIEKQLKAFLIAEAHQNEGQLKSLNHASKPTQTPVSLTFVTDELVIPVGRHRVVCDMLAVRSTKDGDVPVVIEVKGSRGKAGLIDHVTMNAALVDEYSELFAKLFATLLGREVNFVGPSEKWVIWPSATGTGPDLNEGDFLRGGVRMVTFTTLMRGYLFKIHKAPQPVS